MFEDKQELETIVKTIAQLFDAEQNEELKDLMTKAHISCVQTDSNTWNQGEYYYYSVYVIIDVQTFKRIEDRIETIESSILEKFIVATRYSEYEIISKVTISPLASSNIDWSKVSHITSKNQVIEVIQDLQNTMIAISTGGPKIQEVNNQYKQQYSAVNSVFKSLGIENPNPYSDLWEWYGKYSADIPSYKERRIYVSGLYKELIKKINKEENQDIMELSVDVSEWDKINRTLNEIKARHAAAKTEEQFQGIGLLCRELAISLAQAVFDKDIHPIIDVTEISKTDAKRMLDAYICVKLSGSSNETLRKYAKATIDLANELTHKRTATLQDSALCMTATISLINIIGILEDKL